MTSIFHDFFVNKTDGYLKRSSFGKYFFFTNLKDRGITDVSDSFGFHYSINKTIKNYI